MQGTVLLPQQATEMATALQPLLGIITLLCLWQASQLLGQLSDRNRRLAATVPWAVGLLLLLEVCAISSAQPIPLVHLILQIGELLLLLCLARGGLRLPRSQDLKMLFQGMILLITLRLLAGAWLDRMENTDWFHLLTCNNPLCQSLLTGLQVLPLLLLASALFHYGREAAEQTASS